MHAGLLLSTVLLATSAAAAAKELVGRAKAIDGDTLTVADIIVRLQGVAAPELAHPGLDVEEEPGGTDAAAFMHRLVDGKRLICDLTGERTHGRQVGVCRLDGPDVAAEVIAAGLARDCLRYSGERYASIERPEARRLHLPACCEPRQGAADGPRTVGALWAASSGCSGRAMAPMGAGGRPPERPQV